MDKKAISSKIVRILNNNPVKNYKLKTLFEKLHIPKHNYKEFRHIIIMLEKGKKIKRIGRRFSSLRNSKKLIGKFDATALSKNKSFAFVKCNDFDLFVSAEDISNAFHNDIVDVSVQYKNGKLNSGKITKVLKRANEKIIGNVYNHKSKLYLSSDNTKIHSDFAIKNGLSAKTGDKVVLKVSNWGNPQLNILPAGNVIEVLGKSDDPMIETIAVMRQYNLEPEFPQSVIQETKELTELITEQDLIKRENYTGLTTFTIDPISAKDYDDAISLEETEFGVRLYVHIADVSHYVKQDSEIFKEAFKRGTSVYLLQRVVPMLPEKLSNNLCSLRPEEQKLTITVITDFDKNYNIIRQTVRPSIIKSNARLNYQQVDELFETGNCQDISEQVKIDLNKMRILSRKLTEKRHKQGSLDFDLPDAEFEFDEHGTPKNILRTEQTESHLLIEEFMLVANQYIAELLSKKSDYTLYRIHEQPDITKLKYFAIIVKNYGYSIEYMAFNLNFALQDFLNSITTKDHHRVFDMMLLRSLKKAEYSPQNKGHFGLAKQYYTHFTSPIRRFPDLVIHHQIKQYVFKWTVQKFTKEQIEKFAKQSSMQELNAMDAERDLAFRKKMLFMSKYLGEHYEGIIVDFNNSNIFVQLNEFPVEGKIPLSSLKDDYYRFIEQKYILRGERTNKIFQLGQKVKVQVIKVTDSVYFILL